MDDRGSYTVNGETADSAVVLYGQAAFYAFIKHFMSTDVPSYQTLLKNGTPKPEIREISLIHRLYEILFCSESTQLNLIFHDVVVWSLVFPNPYSYMGF